VEEPLKVSTHGSPAQLSMAVILEVVTMDIGEILVLLVIAMDNLALMDSLGMEPVSATQEDSAINVMKLVNLVMKQMSEDPVMMESLELVSVVVTLGSLGIIV
jgi:hypothetical protein